ncbi:MAG: hypothetical protein ABSC62_09990 [Terracidiphilus sp.]
MNSSTVQPDSVEQVQAVIQDWFRGHNMTVDSALKFSRKPQGSAIDIRLPLKCDKKLRFEMKGRQLLFQFHRKKLHLELDKFQVRAGYEGNVLCLNIDSDPASDHHFLASTLLTFRNTKHPAFYTRVLRAVKSFEDDLTNSMIDEATSAPTDHLVMLEAVSSASWMCELAVQDPLIDAKIRGIGLRQQMLKTSGGVLTSEQVAELLNISRQAVDKRRASNQLLALTQGKRGYSYPCFQFDEGRTLKGLEKVLGQLSELDPWMQLNFFTIPSERLGNRTPIDALREGSADDVVSAACGYGEQGAI